MDIQLSSNFVALVRKQPMEIDPSKLPEAAARKVFEYGLQRILNDSSASADNAEEALAMARKRWDALLAGQIRPTRSGGGDPVAREAMRIAIAFVKGHPKYLAWLAENKFKASDKAATDKLRELAADKAKDEKVVAQAKKNVESVDKIDIGELAI